jgi:hypothetical protein
LSDIEAKAMMEDLDLNKDGKISPSEFSLWWLAGRHGKVATMGKLLEARLGGPEYRKSMNVTMKALAEQAKSVDYNIRTSEVEICYNEAYVN